VSLPADYEAPAFESPYRVLVLLAATAGWYEADADQRAGALAALRSLFDRTAERGARLVASFDDDLFLTGQPAPLPYSIYVLYDVDDLAVIVKLVHELRASELAALLRAEARIGRPLFLLSA
jgi:hypothetical protein